MQRRRQPSQKQSEEFRNFQDALRTIATVPKSKVDALEREQKDEREKHSADTDKE